MSSSPSIQLGAHNFAVKLHSPFPQELSKECSKAADILVEFSESLSTAESTLSPQVLASLKGVAVFSVLKVGVGWSGKIGSGVVCARLPDGKWSAPSAVLLLGAGYGPQIGAQVTDFVYLLTSDDSMKVFAQNGQLAFGAQFALAAGSNGKMSESSAVISNNSGLVPGLCYAKTKGLFAGVSLEGAVITVRKDANERFYNEKSITTAHLLSSALEPAAGVEPLYAALGNLENAAAAAAAAAISTLQNILDNPQRSQPYSGSASVPPSIPVVSPQPSAPDSSSSSKLYPVVPSVASSSGHPELPIREELETPGLFQPIAIALYDYTAQRPTDISFSRGDVITIISKSDTVNDWWVGRLPSGKQGRFPANYVKYESGK